MGGDGGNAKISRGISSSGSKKYYRGDVSSYDGHGVAEALDTGGLWKIKYYIHCSCAGGLPAHI